MADTRDIQGDEWLPPSGAPCIELCAQTNLRIVCLQASMANLPRDPDAEIALRRPGGSAL
jgi:hypothetical protein